MTKLQNELYNTLRQIYPNGDSKFYKVIIELMTLYNDKQSDYATRENPYRNFTTVGKMLEEYNIVTKGLSGIKTGIVYTSKQWDAVLKMVGLGQLGKVEGVSKKLLDIAVYSIILSILYEEKVNASK